MIPSVIGKIVWRGKKVLEQVEAQVQQNMDKAAILLQTEIKKSFGSPPVMPEGQLTPYGVRKLASRARKKQARENKQQQRKAARLKKQSQQATKKMAQRAHRVTAIQAKQARQEKWAGKQMKRAMKRGKW